MARRNPHQSTGSTLPILPDGPDARSDAALPPANKRLGQHFLIDPNMVRKIVALAELQPDETVLEIGPGRGILTRALCAEARRVVAVELDRKLTEYLKETFQDCPNLDLRQGDALDFPVDQIPEGTVVVANLPYYVSTPLLFKLLETRHRIDRMVLMLQAEVAQRMVAGPDTEDYGILSVLTQYFVRPTLAFRVSAQCFRPRPEVGSAVVSLAVRRQPAPTVQDEGRFIRTVRAAFAHRRKTLANSLRDEGLAPERIHQALLGAAISPSARAENLSLEKFARLADALGDADPRN